jgi:hypothetical protein
MNEAASSVESEVKTRFEILFVKILKLYSFFLNQFYCLETLEMSSFEKWSKCRPIKFIDINQSTCFPCYYIWVRTNCDMRFINLTHKIVRWTCSSVIGSNEPSNPIRIKKNHSHLINSFIWYLVGIQGNI